MRFKTWPVAALGLGSLLVLIVVSVLTSSRKAQDIYAELDQLNTHHHDVDAKLRRLRSDVNLSGIFVRDYLLDVARERGPEYRQQHRRVPRDQHGDRRGAARARRVTTTTAFAVSQARLDDYWQTFDPLFDWTVDEKILRSAGFLRREVVPRREAVLAIAQEIEELNNANLAAQRAEVARRQAAFRDDLHRLLLAEPAARLWPSRSSPCSGCACWSGDPKSSARSPRTRSTRCASCRSGWSRRRKKSGRTCRASCTITSPRC